MGQPQAKDAPGGSKALEKSIALWLEVILDLHEGALLKLYAPSCRGMHTVSCGLSCLSHSPALLHLVSWVKRGHNFNGEYGIMLSQQNFANLKDDKDIFFSSCHFLLRVIWKGFAAT